MLHGLSVSSGILTENLVHYKNAIAVDLELTWQNQLSEFCTAKQANESCVN